MCWLFVRSALTEGLAAIADSVLTSLNVSFNGITEEGTLSIVRAAQRQGKTTPLDLRTCGIGASGAREIAQYVRVGGELASLILRDDDMDDGAKITLREANASRIAPLRLHL